MLQKRVAVCGARDFNDAERLFKALDSLRAEFGDFAIVTGGYRYWNREARRWEGVDYWAEEWAKARHVWYLGLTAESDRGRFSGAVRSARMLDEARPHLLVAFPGRHATASMKAEAVQRGIPIWEPLTHPLPVGVGRAPGAVVNQF